MFVKQIFIEYFTVVQKAQYEIIVIVVVKIDTFIQMIIDINEIKNIMIQRSFTNFKFFKNALLRAFSFIKALTSQYKHNEIVIKLNDFDAVHSTKNINETRLVKIINDFLKKNHIDVNIKSINKFFNEDLIVQTRSSKNNNILKQNNI